LHSFYKVTDTEIEGKNGTKFIFAGLRRNIENIKSIPNIKKCWVEEAETVSERSWIILLPTIRGEGSEIIISFNPDIEESPTYQRFVSEPPDYAIVKKVNYMDNPFFPEVLELERRECEKKYPDKYDNIWLGNPKAAVEGAIFQKELQRMKDEGRYKSIKYDDRYPVSCFWDIGWADYTSIWFLQIVNHELRVIDFYQSQFERTPHYCHILTEKKYNYDRIVLPHDSDNEYGNAQKTWLGIVKSHFPNAKVYAGKRAPVEIKLEAAKNMFSRINMNKDKCQDGYSALARFHYEINPDTGKSSRNPYHGTESHASDAFCYMCLELIEPNTQGVGKIRIKQKRSSPEWAKRIGLK